MTHRFFRADVAAINAVRQMIIDSLGLPNGKADEPFRSGGDFQDETGRGYVALGEHHTIGEYAPLVDQALSTPGVEEIDETTYRANVTQEEPTP